MFRSNLLLYSSLYLRNAFFGLKFPTNMTVDVTNVCNLSCKHCYFVRSGFRQQLSDSQMIDRLRQVKAQYKSIASVSWAGGEPLLRRRLLKSLLPLFPFNAIFTNGTLAIPGWDCVFNVSVDGTKKEHDTIRGKGVYGMVKKNIAASKARINLVCVLNTVNSDCVEPMLKEWKNTNVSGISFDFHTPAKANDSLWLDWKKRDKIVMLLQRLRKEYGNFILNSGLVLELMLSKNACRITKDCLVPKAAICLDPMGKQKLPCMIGKDADCSRCGCSAAFFAEAVLKRNDLGSVIVTRKFLT